MLDVDRHLHVVELVGSWRDEQTKELESLALKKRGRANSNLKIILQFYSKVKRDSEEIN